jgi:hypothetical protein
MTTKRVILVGASCFLVALVALVALALTPPCRSVLSNSLDSCLETATAFDPFDPDTFARIKWEQRLKNKDPKVRKRAAEELGNLYWKARPAVPALLDVLNDDEDGEVIEAAAEALPKIDPKAAHNAGLDPWKDVRFPP